MYKYLSPAKLNLFLRITNQRQDGYHNLQSIVIPINLHDTITIELRPDNKILRKINIDVPFEEDLAIKAVIAMQKFSGIQSGLEIDTQKNIPIGAGLGGGSSNAASVLLALNQLWEINLSTDALCKIALTLGADVPFFIHQNSAWVEGIGEKITPIKLDKYFFIIVKPSNYISTKSIFTDPNLEKQSIILDQDKYIQTIHSQSIIDNIKMYMQLNNCMEQVVLQTQPNINEWLTLQKYNNLNFRMTGSGSCFFCMFSSKEERDISIEKVILPDGWNYYLCESIE